MPSWVAGSVREAHGSSIYPLEDIREASGITRIVEIAHDDSLLVRSHIRAIAVDYRRRFAQQSVLVTQSRSLQCFEGGNGSK